jgi:hypothetical protein
MRTTSSRAHGPLGILGLAALICASVAAAQELDPRESYSYLRTVEGTVTITSAGNGPAADTADVNQPLLSGDQVRLARGSRAEAVLADRTLLRLGGGTSLTLARVAFSGDRADRVTQLDIEEGEILLQVGDDALGDQLPEIRTQGATVYLQQPGLYRVTADRGGWTEVLVREGYAEIVSDRGSTVVRAGEIATVLADRFGRVEIARAPGEDALERWGLELYDQARTATTTVVHVDPYLSYAAAPLAGHGDWVYVDASWAWRPRVATGWRPYWNGRWCPTPSGLTWVSYEPWGWVPYHYGSWFMDASYGWCWRPGRVYSPAWVYWHWSDNWVGWVPIGYYTSYYSRFGFHDGFRFGVYGWAGGGWGAYADWHFVPSWCLRQRDWRRHQHTGHDLERLEPGGPQRGIVTTDTRGLTRERLGRPREIVETLASRRGAGNGSLVDVTDFVARKNELPPRVADAVGARGEPAVPGTPLAPRGGVDRKADVEPGWRSGSPAGKVSTEPAEVPARGRRLESPATEPGKLSREPAPADVPRRLEPGTSRGARIDPEPSTPPARTRIDPGVPTDSRQGWKTGVAPTPATPPSTSGRGAVREEPVQRVIGGVRRAEPVAPRTGSEPRGGSVAPPPSGSPRYVPPATNTPRTGTPQGSSPRYSPPATSSPRNDPPATGSPRYVPPATSSPRYSPPATSSPRYSPPATSSPRYSPPASGSPRYVPPAGSSRGPAVGSSPGTSARPPVTTSPRSSSPPPRTASPAPRSAPPRASSPPPRASSPKSSSPPPRASSSGSGQTGKSSGQSGGSTAKRGGDGHR